MGRARQEESGEGTGRPILSKLLSSLDWCSYLYASLTAKGEGVTEGKGEEGRHARTREKGKREV